MFYNLGHHIWGCHAATVFQTVQRGHLGGKGPHGPRRDEKGLRASGQDHRLRGGRYRTKEASGYGPDHDVAYTGLQRPSQGQGLFGQGPVPIQRPRGPRIGSRGPVRIEQRHLEGRGVPKGPRLPFPGPGQRLGPQGQEARGGRPHREGHHPDLSGRDGWGRKGVPRGHIGPGEGRRPSTDGPRIQQLRGLLHLCQKIRAGRRDACQEQEVRAKDRQQDDGRLGRFEFGRLLPRDGPDRGRKGRVRAGIAVFRADPRHTGAHSRQPGLRPRMRQDGRL